MKTFGKYIIIQEIGRGGFATVYRARDLDLDREVALKLLHPLLMSDPLWVRRFRQEARAIARLEHPHIVTIYEVGESEGRLFIAMQLARNGDLAQRIGREGALPWETTVNIINQVAGALDFAHQQGVIHRDLKPSNILFDRTAGVLLTDFGFAHIVGDNSLSRNLSATSRGVVGTPAYIAPDIWENKFASPQSDVYSLGCIAYELITGGALFTGDTEPAVMRAHFQPRKFPEVWPAGTPAGLQAVLERAVAIEPNQRYGSASEFARALSALSAASEISKGADSVKAVQAVLPSEPIGDAGGHKWPLWAGVIVLLLALSVGAWWFFGRQSKFSPTAVAQTSAPPATPPPLPTATFILAPTATYISVPPPATSTPTSTPVPTATPLPTPTPLPSPTPTLDTSTWQPFIDKGVAAYNRGDWQQVVQAFTEAIALMPDYAPDKPEAYNYRGWAYYRLGEDEKAIQDFSRAIELNPDFARAYNNRGVAYNDLQRYATAIPDFTKAIALDHQPLIWPYANRGYSYYRLGQLPQALADLDKCIEIQTDYASCYLQRGHVYNKMGNTEAARRDYNTCIQLTGDNYPGNFCTQALQKLPIP